jgi:urease accessory protein
MILIERVIGNEHDPQFVDLIHALEHQRQVDSLVLSKTDLQRHRLRAKTVNGQEIAVALPRDQMLFDGAVLLLESARAIVVRAEAERWLKLDARDIPDALELGYHAGNLHWRVRFEGSSLLVAMDDAKETYLARLRSLATSGRLSYSVVERLGGP